MIDFHSHILPGVDDGSQSVEMSRAMLELLVRQGVTAVAATPHFYPTRSSPADFLQRRQAALAVLGETPIPVIPGAEVAYFDGLSRCDALEDLQLQDTDLLLVEMPFSPWSSRAVEELCVLSIQTGLTPVLAHVDRYPDQMKKYGSRLLDFGVLFQCNASAFLSPRTKGWALKMLKKGQLHFLGSDCHNLTTRPPRMDEAAAVIRKKLGEHPILTEEI